MESTETDRAPRSRCTTATTWANTPPGAIKVLAELDAAARLEAFTPRSARAPSLFARPASAATAIAPSPPTSACGGAAGASYATSAVGASCAGFDTGLGDGAPSTVLGDGRVAATAAPVAAAAAAVEWTCLGQWLGREPRRDEEPGRGLRLARARLRASVPAAPAGCDPRVACDVAGTCADRCFFGGDGTAPSPAASPSDGGL